MKIDEDLGILAGKGTITTLMVLIGFRKGLCRLKKRLAVNDVKNAQATKTTDAP